MNSLRVIAVVTVTALIGCASTPPARSSKEPGVIALRNSTGRALATVRIGEERRSAGSPTRLGEMSPVLPDVTYTFVRPPKAPPLPSKVRVQWRDGSGTDHSTVVAIREAVDAATGVEGEALLLEIRPSGSVAARIDRAPAAR